MLFKHFFWDFDGTLFDTYPRVTRAFLKGLRDLGGDMPYDRMFWLVKHSLLIAAEECTRLFDIPVNATLDAYHAHAEEEGDETMRPYPGVREVLHAVCSRGGSNYLYTHRGLSSIDALEKQSLLTLFSDCVTQRDGFPSKPAPDALLFLVKKRNLDLRDCVMVGDRDIDLDAAKNAGMAGTLYDPDGMFPDYPAAYRFDDMQAFERTLVQV